MTSGAGPLPFSARRRRFSAVAVHDAPGPVLPCAALGGRVSPSDPRSPSWPLVPLVRRLRGPRRFSHFLLAFRRSPCGFGALRCPRPCVAGRSVLGPLGIPWGPLLREFLPGLPRYAAGLWLAADRPWAFPCGSRHGQSVGLSESLQLRVHATHCPAP